jgi:hypothetical protein
MTANERMDGILAIEREMERLEAEHALELKHLRLDLGVATLKEAKAALAVHRKAATAPVYAQCVGCLKSYTEAEYKPDMTHRCDPSQPVAVVERVTA